MLWLLFGNHRRLRMISETLELCVEGEQVSYSWFVCVAGHGYGGLGGGRDRCRGWYVCDKAQGIGRMSEDTGALIECEVIHR